MPALSWLLFRTLPEPEVGKRLLGDPSGDATESSRA
jgi:hypothetical protein